MSPAAQRQPHGSHCAGMALALGAHSEQIENPADLPPALERALANAQWSPMS